MKLTTIVWRETFERKNQLVTSFLAITLGITAVVAIRNITFYSEKAVALQLDNLGMNVLILPKSATVQDYYSADMQDDQIPEEYVDQLAMSDLQGLDNISPKLSLPVEVAGKKLTLTGILPKKEFQAKAAWQGAGIFSRPAGCGTVEAAGTAKKPMTETLVRKRVIDTLAANEALVGAEVAAGLHLSEGQQIQVLGKSFSVTAILPQTGTVDDSRIFAHLHTVQELTGKGSVINAIEVVGCCNEISQGLVQKINKLLPDAKVVTVRQVVDTQVNTNWMMARLSIVFLVIIVLVGGASIANYMYANVFERRREIGTMMALGASSSLILWMFILKALLLGLVGGVCGCVLGTLLAMTLGPRLAGIAVLPMPGLLALAVLLSLMIALCASLFPARRATRLDPCATLQEV
jgi:putative ABC transport system permease protein